RTEICNGQRVNFTSAITQNSAHYKWYVNNTLQIGVNGSNFSTPHLKDQDGVFCVAEFADLCVDTSNVITITVLPQCLTSIYELEEKGIKVFPNPAIDYLNIQFKNADNYHLSLSDITGKQIGVWNVSETNTSLPISHIPRGMYFLSILSNEHMYQLKIIFN
ncbi:MAG: T9SS type A sorting domain-containing protein, partial [Cytophagaceae bacterium]